MYEKEIENFVNACHQAASYGLLSCSSGNMSCRVSDELVALSASKVWLSEITPQQVAVCRIDTGKSVNAQTATIESNFHLGILESRPELNVVLHFQSPCATAIAAGEPKNYNFNTIIEVPVYIGEPAIVDFFLPGSAELAQAVIEAMKDHQMVIMRNHGLVTAGGNFKETIQRAVFFELACQILILQQQPQPLPKEAVELLSKVSKA